MVDCTTQRQEGQESEVEDRGGRAYSCKGERMPECPRMVRRRRQLLLPRPQGKNRGTVMNIEDRKHDYICRECADDCGGVWPEGHAATFHQGECGVCGKEKALCNVGDYNWPDKARGMRD